MKKISHHRLGSSDDIIIYHPNSKFYFIPIPKNASSYIYESFSKIGWQYFKLYYHDQVKDKIPIVVYRDPIERWFSGFAQDYSLYKFSDDIHEKTITAQFFKQGFYGIHTVTQHWYLKHYKLYNAVFIKFTKPFTNIVNILKDNVDNIDKISISKGHGSVKDYQVEEIIKDHYYNEPINQKNLQDYLKDDLEFYSTIKFIDGTKTLPNYKLWDSYKRTESI